MTFRRHGAVLAHGAPSQFKLKAVITIGPSPRCDNGHEVETHRPGTNAGYTRVLPPFVLLQFKRSNLSRIVTESS